MRAYHPAGLALAAGLLGFVSAGPAVAQTLDPELTRAAQCAGIIKGNAVADLILGVDEERVEADIYLSNIYLLGVMKQTLGGMPEDPEFEIYQQIHMNMVDEVIRIIDAGDWDASDYKEAINCFAAAGVFFLDELPKYRLSKKKIRETSADQLADVKIMLGLK